jgi:hypothetical protein
MGRRQPGIAFARRLPTNRKRRWQAFHFAWKSAYHNPNFRFCPAHRCIINESLGLGEAGILPAQRYDYVMTTAPGKGSDKSSDPMRSPFLRIWQAFLSLRLPAVVFGIASSRQC